MYNKYIHVYIFNQSYNNIVIISIFIIRLFVVLDGEPNLAQIDGT